MQSRTNAFLVLAYTGIAVIAAILVFWSGARFQSQNQKLQQLLAEIDETKSTNVKRPERDLPRRSMRSSLMRLQDRLEERTFLVREQQNQLKQQISGREELQQKYEKLSEAYNRLSNEHQLLINEVDFYLDASVFALQNSQAEKGTDLKDDQDRTEGISSTLQSADTLSPEQVSNVAELAELEATSLRQELAELTINSQRNALVAGYASQAMIELGESAIPLLRSLLEDGQADARAWAVWMIGEIGPNAATAIPDVRILLDDEDEAVASAAADALQKLGSP